MVVFDVLDNLETYSSVIPHMDDVVYVMDHSKPYDDSVGEYECRTNSEVKYKVSAHLSSETGFPGEEFPSHIVLEICLEGEEIVSVEGGVFKLSQGRFLAYSGEGPVKRGVMLSTPTAFKTVRFIL